MPNNNDDTSVNQGVENKQSYRLPTNVCPTHYDLIFKSDLEALIYEGQGIIHLDVKAPIKQVIFNFSPAFNLTRLSLKNAATGEVCAYQVPYPIQMKELETDKEDSSIELPPPGDISNVHAGELLVDEKQQQIALGVPESWELDKDAKITLHASWTDNLGDSMIGYYKSSWKKDGKDAHYALTQFEATSARLAYPSWDEPALKSTYTIAMISRKGLTNLSNMPAVEEKAWTGSIELDGGMIGEELSDSASEEWVVTKFQKTPLISSYLVAWANGEFAHLDSSYTSPLSGRIVPLRIYATPDCIHQAQFALDVKAKVMPLCEEMFDIEYPLPKLDTLVASSFEAGAMENWGLITGRTSGLLWDPKTSSLAAKKNVIQMMAHECAHMWFGNVVSPEWWTYLWLNEAFATLMGSVIMPDRIFPELNAGQEFLTGHLARALGLDSIRSSHPIEVDCPDAAMIRQVFDGISYSKGASVLRMLAAVVGEEKFLKGVSVYLKKRLYGTAVTEDLWDGISEASDVDIVKIMKEWICETGFPVITVEEQEGIIKVRQNRFLATGDVQAEEDEKLWYVPLELKVVGKDGTISIDHSAILHEREASFNVTGAQAFKLNAETVGVYRVVYSPERLLKLGEEAAKKDSGFTTEDRIGLVSDVMTLGRAGYSKTSGGLNLISKLSGEQEFRVWDSISMSLHKLKDVWWEQPEEVRAAIDKFRIECFALSPNDWAGNSKKGRIPQRPNFVHLPSPLWPVLRIPIPVDVQQTIYVIAVRYGGEAEYRKIREVYDNPPNPVCKINALYALSSSKKKDLLQATFEMITDGSILDQDVMYAFFALVSNRLARRDVVAYFKDNYTQLEERFGENFGMRRLVNLSFGFLSNQKDLDDINAFFEGKDTEKYNLTLEQAKDSILAAVGWLERDREDVSTWLQENQFLSADN